MEPILNRSEIAELLQAIKHGKVPLDIDDNDEESFLSCSEIDLFNLTRPDTGQFKIPNFDIIIDSFCRLYATSLTNQLQRNFSINRTSLKTLPFQDVMSGKNNPGAIGILDMQPLKHGALIVLDPQLSFSMIEIMLGASSELDSLQLDRNLTTIELNLLKTIISDACEDINKAFVQICDLDTTLMKLENNPRLVSIVDPEAEVIASTLLVKVGEYTGEINLVFPSVTIDPIKDLFKELLSITKKKTSIWQEVIEEEISQLPTTITAQSGILKLTVNQILKMKVGDVFEADYDISSPVTVLIEDIPKFSAIPGTHNGKKAICLQ